MTQLPRTGTTGVQRYFNEIERYFKQQDIDVAIITPYSERNTLLRKVLNIIGRALRTFSREWSELWGLSVIRSELVKKLRRELRDIQGQIVLYAQDPRSALAAHESSKKLGRKDKLVWIGHFFSSESEEFLERGLTRKNGALYHIMNESERKAVDIADYIVLPSEFMRNVLVDRHPEYASKIFVSPNFVYTPPPGIRRDRDMIYDLITVGRLEERKNHAYLLEIVHLARGMGKKYRLAVVGDGPERQRLTRLAEQLGIAEQVTFLGNVPEAVNLIRQARVYAHVSKVESFGIVIIEAMSQGRPVLATPVGGVTELLEDGVQGRFWPLENPGECANILINLLEDDTCLQQMSSSARARYELMYSPEVAGLKLSSVLLK